ncbi:energy-coupling factor transporter ATPase [Thermosyntropha sp.]|uniref:energy-coupling factor transporter ATPase n=1 Tax=Thermosyntropha sp. TaxID=2740820 RepID=UPI0025E8F879|nr:energy-coupling factor transporter ATPase [Thermosyntropha sp.]MBO8158070.1 energy-coupling factor transporter ATPase [Thermosyntropha sp.]
MIEFVNVHYYYKENSSLILNNISFTINKGEFIGIVGRNGSGKSTLARMFNGILIPSKGKVLVDGLDTRKAEDLIKIRRKVGLLLPNPDNQIVSSVVEEDVAFGLENLGIKPEEIRLQVDEALKLVEMEEFKKHPPYLLSGGQKQRVALAGILALKPDYLVLDEPTSMIEPEGRKLITGLLKQINSELGVALIWITHDLEEIIEADRILVVANGKVKEYKKPKELLGKADIWKEAGIEPLAITQFMQNLKQYGIDFKPEEFTVQEMVDFLCRLK